MLQSIIAIRNRVIGFCYRHILKKIFFTMDPEKIHDIHVKIGHTLGKNIITRKITAGFFSYSDKKLEQDILGIHFSNPIGLAAGFDKNAELTDILPAVGFGFAEIGSITGEPCLGNPKPRLWRLKESKSLVVYYGLKNPGCEAVAAKLANKKFKIPIGVSIAKTNCQATADMENGVKDYVKAYKTMFDIGNYTTVNISCPNAFGGQPFTDKKSLEYLLNALSQLSVGTTDGKLKIKPIFIKLSPDLSIQEVDDIIEVAEKYNVDGYISSNLTKNRNNIKIKNAVPSVGGMSGKVVEGLSNNLIRHLYKKTKGKKVIIGCGGVFSAEDAYYKIKAGASLIQMITGMIFEGPQIISDINLGLVKLLERDGFKNISEAIGTEK